MHYFISADEARALKKVLYLDARDEAAYAAGHIPGAIRWDPHSWLFNDLAKQETSKLPKQVALWIRQLGINGDETVVVYQNAVGTHAARGLWFLRYAGHDHSFVLRGGIEAWGRPLSTETPPKPKMGRFLPAFRTEELAMSLYVLSSINDPKRVILDVRSKGEHSGGDGSRNCCKRKGRIPESSWLEWTEFFTEKQADLKDEKTLKKTLAAGGITPDKEIIAYCHRGARAAAAYLALKELGYKKVRIYLAGWHVWAANPNLPIEQG